MLEAGVDLDELGEVYVRVDVECKGDGLDAGCVVGVGYEAVYFCRLDAFLLQWRQVRPGLREIDGSLGVDDSEAVFVVEVVAVGARAVDP